MNYNWKKAVLGPNSTIKDAINCLNISSIKLILVVNKVGKLIGTITDGDIRRGLIKSFDLTTWQLRLFCFQEILYGHILY